jgi:ABC-type glycerol-3-phosphate transport system substrate-binding protein
VPIIFLTFGLVAGAIWWLVTSRGYQEAKVPMVGAPPSIKVNPVVVWAYADSATADLYRKTIQGLQDVYPNKLILRLFPTREQMVPALQQAAGNQKLPDVFLGEIQDLSGFYQAAQLSPILLREVSTYEWLPNVLQPFVRAEALLAYPSEYSVQVLYYNRQHFDRVGLAYADTDWTWDTLMAIARTLYRAPDDPQGGVYGLEYAPSLECWNALACQHGKGLYEGSRWFWGLPESAGAVYDALKFLIDLQSTHTFCAPITRSTLPTQFLQGNCAMAIAGPELRARLQRDSPFQWGCTLLPRKIDLATPLSARGWAISANSQSAETARGLARILSGVVTSGWLPAHTSTPSPEDPSYLSVFQISLRYARPPYTGPQAAQVKNLVDRALSRLNEPAMQDANTFIAELESALAPLKLNQQNT